MSDVESFLPSVNHCINLKDKVELNFDQLKKVVREKSIQSMVREEEKLIILIDIVSFSQSDTKAQFANIFIFQNYLRSFLFSKSFLFGEKIRINHFIPTGDGCYIIADVCESDVALDFLVKMIAGFQSLKDFYDKAMSIRVSALIGDCVPFMDLAHHKNYVGEGMNEASRILTGGRNMLETLYMKEGHSEEEAKCFSRNTLFLGDSLCENLDFYKKDAENFFSFENVPDKHDKMRNIKVLQGIHEYK